MKARYISGSGAEGTAAVIEVDGEQYECMDCLGYGRGRGYRPGDIFYVGFAAGLVKHDRKGTLVTGPNERHAKVLESLGGWRYRAYGVLVVGDRDVLLDCGAVNVELSPGSVDAGRNGDYVAVDIERMDCWRRRGPRSHSRSQRSR